jgi:transposase-like protein
VDETYIRVAGAWSYLYGTVDSTGATIDFLFAAERDAAAAKRFFQRALKVPGRRRPRVINVDGNPSYPKVITELKQARNLGRRCRCRTCPYLNNIITAASGSDNVMPPPGLCRVSRLLVVPACLLKVPDAA